MVDDRVAEVQEPDARVPRASRPSPSPSPSPALPALSLIHACSQKPYKGKLEINAVDLTDPDGFANSYIASKIEINEEETEQKFTPPPSASSLHILAVAASGAEAATPEAATAEAATAKAATATSPGEFCEDQSSAGVLDFGIIGETPASLSVQAARKPAAKQPAAKQPAAKQPAAKPQSPAGTGGDAPKAPKCKRKRPPLRAVQPRVRRIPLYAPRPRPSTEALTLHPRPMQVSPMELSEYEMQRLDNIKRNNGVLAGLGIEPLHPAKKAKVHPSSPYPGAPPPPPAPHARCT